MDNKKTDYPLTDSEFMDIDDKLYILIQKTLESQTVLVSNTLRRNGAILICGSLSMQFGVEKVIAEIASQELNLTIEELKNNKQIRTDCY